MTINSERISALLALNKEIISEKDYAAFIEWATESLFVSGLHPDRPEHNDDR